MTYRRTISKTLLMGVLVSFLIFPSTTGNSVSQNCIAPPPDLISWWPGDGNANDISGNEQNGTPSGGVSFAQGKVGQGFLFDGIDGRIEIPDSSVLRFGTGDLTVDAWIKAAPGTDFRGIIGKELQAFPFPSIVFRLSDQGLLQFAVTDCGTGECGFGVTRQPVQSPFRVDDDVFHHLAGVRHSSGYELYVDGQLVATRVEPARNSDSTAPLFIGIQAISTNGSVMFPFQGLVDEVEIFDRALTGAEIQALFAADSAGKCKRVTICHKPGTPAQKSVVIPIEALPGHLGHGDTVGQCN